MSPLLALPVALGAGALIGLSLGALGGGGSILAVPVLVYLLDQSAVQATTGALVVVGVTSAFGAVAAHRQGLVRPGRGAAFGAVGIGGAALGARAAVHVPDDVLLGAFAALMLVVGLAMAVRHRRTRPGSETTSAGVDTPILRLREGFLCDCPRAVKVLVTATGVGLLTGFLGVGGGFLVVPALVLALGLPMATAAGTSLLVITITSTVALLVRAGSGAAPDWGVVAALTAASALAAVAGTRVAARTDTRRLAAAFTALVLAVATYTAARTAIVLV